MNIRQIRENFQHYGLRAGIHDVTRKAIGRVMDFKIIRCLDLQLGDVDPAFLSPDPAFTGRFLGEDDLLRWAADEVYDLPADFVRETLARGDRCYGLLQGDTLASYGWYSKRPTEFSPELIFHFDPADVYMYKGFTLPAFRGKRLHAVGMARALQAYVDEGSRAIVSYVDSNNFPSLRSCYRLGYRDIGSIYVARPRDRFYVFSTGRCLERGIWIEPRAEGAAGAAHVS